MDKYDFELDLSSRNSLKLINDRIKPHSHVLEFGCANGRLTKYLVKEKHCIVDIVEISETAGRNAAKFARNSLIGDKEGNIENFYWVDIYNGNRYDYIIFADVLEHLYNPFNVLDRCRCFLKENGSIVLSVPNIAHSSVILNLLQNEFRYTRTGLLDDTHIRFFTVNSLDKMINDLNYKTIYRDAVFSEVGENEIPVTYGMFSKFNTECIKYHLYANVYQYIYEITNANSESDIDDRLSWIENDYNEFMKKYVGVPERIRALEQYKKMYDTISNSTTWKATEPIRLLFDKLKSLKIRKNIKYCEKRFEIKKSATKSRIAVQAHIYYVDLLEELISYINNIKEKHDLYVSICDENQINTVKEILIKKSDALNIEIMLCPNLGRDVAPLLKQMGRKMLNYEYFCHVHTKKSKHVSFGDSWRRYLLKNLLGSEEYTAEIIKSFDNDKRIGIIYPDNYEKIKGYVNLEDNLKLLGMLSKIIDVNFDSNNIGSFPAGDMFWARTNAVRQVFEKDFKWKDFPLEKGQLDMTIMHAIERSWVKLVEYNSYCKVEKNITK